MKLKPITFDDLAVCSMILKKGPCIELEFSILVRNKCDTAQSLYLNIDS